MNPAEREELARLLPSPGDPVLPRDRHLLLKDHLMHEITPRAEHESITPAPKAPRPRPRPRRRLVLIALPAVTAAAVTAALVAGAVSEKPVTDQRAVDLLNRIATVAAAKKAEPVRDDQYVYVSTQGTQEVRDDDKDYGTQTFRRTDWQPVDGKRSGLARIKILSGANPYTHGGDMKLNRDPNVTYYRELEALPTDPGKLYRKVWDDTEGEGQTHEAAALEEIGSMLPSATLLPDLNAALYRAAAKIPGVSVVDDAKDIAGRHGIGLTFKDGDDRDTWVFDRESLNFLGTDEVALLDAGVVDRVGELPKN